MPPNINIIPALILLAVISVLVGWGLSEGAEWLDGHVSITITQ